MTGTENVKKDTTRSHGRSRSHTRAVEQQKKQDDLASQFRNMGSARREKMSKLFDWAYFIAKDSLPFTAFPKVVKVERKHGVDVGSKYINDKQCHNFILAIAETMVIDLKKEFATTPFYFSWMFDGSTDKTLSEKEVASVKLLENGESQIKLVG